jgi:lysophospholipase L1-like esterase
MPPWFHGSEPPWRAAQSAGRRNGWSPWDFARNSPGYVMANRRSVLKAGGAWVAGLRPDSNAKHVLMLGDSIFDNAAYVAGHQDVQAQVQDLLPSMQVSSRARDGAVIADIDSQLGGFAGTATHIVVSIGGNDAIRASGVLDEGVSNVSAALEKLTLVGERFGHGYASLMKLVSQRNVPVALCTIYEPRFPDPARRRAAAAALSVINDVITRQVFRAGASLIDLRLICDRDEDFANPIEPSTTGGAKIARAIARFAEGQVPNASVFAGSGLPEPPR